MDDIPPSEHIDLTFSKALVRSWVCIGDVFMVHCFLLFQEGRLQEVIETLLSLEKQTRTVSR